MVYQYIYNKSTIIEYALVALEKIFWTLSYTPIQNSGSIFSFNPVFLDKNSQKYID